MRRILLQKLHASSLRGGGCFAQRRWFSEAVAVQLSTTSDIVSRLKDWFKSSPHTQTDRLLDLDRIFEILRAPSGFLDGDDIRLHLSRLRLRLSEDLVLRVLSHGGNDFVSCIKFFDWASRQPGFHHTRATFHAYFKLLRRTGLMPDFSIRHSLRFCDALVIGYSVVGRTDIALQHFGNMRFRGLDLDSFGYHVLLNALVEENCFDTVDVIVDQISSRGFLCAVTHSILVKSFCKQGRLAEAEHYFRGLLKTHDDPVGCSSTFSLLVDALCSHNLFPQAAKLIDEIRGLPTVCMDRAYSIWIKALIRAGDLHGAMHFLQKLSEKGSAVEVFRYNSLILELLRNNQLVEVCDVIVEMIKQGVSPDKVTMNVVLCFFCKVGIVDVALNLYRSKSEIGLTPTALAYNYLVNTLCKGDRGSVDEAYGIFKESIDQGHFPGRKTFQLLVEALREKKKLDNMKELALVAFNQNLMESRVVYDRFVSALCDAGCAEESLLMHEALSRAGISTTGNMFINLILVSVRSKKGDIAAKLLIEMQKKGYAPTRRLYRTVLCCLCEMEKGVHNFINLLKMQLSLVGHRVEAYNYFIDGAGHAKKPDLAREVYEKMKRDGITPNLVSNILMLQSYVENGRFSDAANFFDVLREKGEIRRKLYHTMIVRLCRANKGDSALLLLNEMRTNMLRPSIECYEEVIQNMCTNRRYRMAVQLVNEFRKTGRCITSFIGNVLLFNALKSQGLYEAWIQMTDVEEGIPEMRLLGELIGIFSGRVRMTGQIKTLDEVIEKCYPLDLYTYNMLLRMQMMEQVGEACEMVERIRRRGYKLNEWTHRILASGFSRARRVGRGTKMVETVRGHGRMLLMKKC